MAEPREFYYPLQDKAADIDRVLHDLVDITDTEESLGMYVKVIEVEGQPHFWFGEGGEKQKPIEVDEWELPAGDGQDWVRKSCIYTPYQTGVIMEENLSKDQLDLAVVFTSNIRQQVSSGDPPASTVNTFIKRVGVTNNYKSTNLDPSISPYSFGSITETLFNNLFNNTGFVSLSIYACVDPFSVSSSTKFYLCDVIHDEDSGSYNVFLTYNEQTHKIANVSYESRTKRMVIERFYNNNYGTQPSEKNYHKPALKFVFSFKSCNGVPFNFNFYNYYFGFAADDTPYWTQEPATIWWEVNPDVKISSPILKDESKFSPINWLSTNMVVKAGIYSIGVKPEKGNVDLLYIGPLKNDLGQASQPSSSILGITLKQGGNLSLERTIFDCQDGKVIFKGGHIDLSADGDLAASGNSRGWDGTRGGTATNTMRSGEPLVVMHGDPLLQMLHESTLHMTEGASIEMDGETLLSIHDLTKIDMSGAPYIQIHGTSNKSDDAPLKYGIPNRQPYITIDDGSTISMSGAAGDPFLFLKGAGGIIFNNNHGAVTYFSGSPYRGGGRGADPINKENGPLIMVNEDELYFDGFGTEGAISHTPRVNPLDLSMNSLDKYRDKDWEQISQQISEKGYANYNQSVENLISKIRNISSGDPIIWRNTLSVTEGYYYAKSVGEEFEQYVLDNDKFSLVGSLRKFYYLRVDAYNVVNTIVNALTDYPEIQLKNDIYIEISVGHDLYGQTPVEEEFERQGLNIDDYIVGVAYRISCNSDLFSSFTTYYNNKYGTTSLPLANIVYKQRIANNRGTSDFLNLYYGKSLLSFTEDYNSDYFTMQSEEYEEIQNYYLDYNNNKDNASYYYTIDNDSSTIHFIQKRFLPLVKEYYRLSYPCFQERVHASNSIVILGGETGSTSWVKIGGDAGEHTELGVLNNAKVWIEDKAEVKLSGAAWLNIDKEFGIVLTENINDYLLPSAAQFVIGPAELIDNEWTGGFIAISDRHDQIIFTIDHLRKALNGEASSANNVTYDNTSSGMTATNVQDAIDELVAGGGGSSGTSVYEEEVLWDTTTSTDTQGQYTLSKAITDFDAICFKVNWNQNGIFKFITVLPASTLIEEIGTSSKIAVATGDIQYLYIQVSNDSKFIQQDTYNSVSMSKIIGIKYGTSVSSLNGVGF